MSTRAETERDGEAAPLPFVNAIPPSLALGVVSGATAGLLWGGIGGRIAMRVVFLTSSDSVRGITSDDGFEVGVFSGQTVVLLVFAMILGALAGVPIGLIRPFLSTSSLATAAGLGVATGLAAGGSIVHTGGVDFRFLDPLWLTVGFFVVLPGAWAATVVIAIDRLAARLSPVHTSPPPWRGMVVAAWLAVGVVAALGAIDLLGDMHELTRQR